MTEEDESPSIQEMLNNGFFWSFKKGDNAVHNFEILAALYEAKMILGADKFELLNKPILLTIVSIIEVIFDDFFCRIIQYRNEKIPNLSDDAIQRVRVTKKGNLFEIDSLKFEITLQRAEEKDLFFAPPKFYEVLGELQDARNRIHIQNQKYKLDPDEVNVFTNERLIQAQKALEHIIKIMLEKYPRHGSRYLAADFPFPWLSV